jgi:serine phosphatase RsbU (regulator of sigma subunit)
MDGFEVCLRLKLDPATRDIPVVFLTGATEVADETRGFEVGGVDYIHKPFSQAVVRARVHNHLMLREAREKLARQLAEIRNELETAKQIQLSILPREPAKIDGLDIAACYKAMASVAGDFYDFIRVDDKRLGTLVADVSGHGMPAALISSMLKIAFAEQAAFAADPAQLLTALNQTLCGKFRGHFVTAAYVFIDTEAKILRYAGAGHPPLLLRGGPSGAVSEVLENGLFLGSFPQAVYSAVEKPFEIGDWIVLYTDGIVEMNDPKEQEFGVERLKGFLEKNGSLPAANFIDATLAELSRWADGKEVEDDLTLLAIRFEDLMDTTNEGRK